jgi:hypothetical protein
MTVPDPKSPPRHPFWCHRPLGDIAEGGAHRSRPRLATDPLNGRTLVADLVQAGSGGPRVRLSVEGDPTPPLQLGCDTGPGVGP